MVCIIYQFCKVKFAGVIELKAGNAVHRLCWKIRICFELVYDLLLCRCKRTFKSADDGHWNDYILIFIASIWSTQFVCDRPNKVYFCRNINRRIIPHCVYHLFISHCCLPLFSIL